MNVFELAGVVFDRNEPPWWVVNVLGWLYAVKCLMDASGKLSAYKTRCKDYLDHKPPGDIYKLFRDYVDRLEHEEYLANR